MLWNKRKRMEKKWMKYVGSERQGNLVTMDEEAFGDLKVTYMCYRSRGRSEFVVTFNRRARVNGEIKWWRGLNHKNLEKLYDALPRIHSRLRDFESS